MVRVSGGPFQWGNAPAVELPPYLLDKYEVTNLEFKKFVDGGGYRKPEYWKEPFVKEGHTLTWEQAVQEFRDRTGRPGPATWELETIRKARMNFREWCELVRGRGLRGIRGQEPAHRLPVVQRRRAQHFADNVRLSNFSSNGPVNVGSLGGISPYGSYDMAGNVKEWCWNRSGGRRYILGGGYNEAGYMFVDEDAQSPFGRLPTYGIRLMKNIGGSPPEALTRPIEQLTRDFTKEKPVPDQVFNIYKAFYAYDRTDLQPHVESVDDTSQYWRTRTDHL